MPLCSALMAGKSSPILAIGMNLNFPKIRNDVWVEVEWALSNEGLSH